MDLNEYQRLAMRTKNRGDIGGIPDLAVAGLGIAGEAGEVADEIKKVLGHGKAMDTAKLKKELGDVLWYCASVAEDIGTTLGEVAELNVAKLKARYPNGFSTGDSVAKADEAGQPFEFKPVQVPSGVTDTEELKRRLLAGETVTVTAEGLPAEVIETFLKLSKVTHDR